MTIYGVKKTTNLTSALLYLELYIFMVEHSPTYLPIRKITYTVIHLPTYKIDRCFLGSPRGQNQIKFSSNIGVSVEAEVVHNFKNVEGGFCSWKKNPFGAEKLQKLFFQLSASKNDADE